MTAHENALAKESSAYLRSAGHQPVDWMPWSEEAFARAEREGKPILLDIGAVWCHWCHVMDHESYEDPLLAEVINKHFVAVKVDRDERPDVDTRYQKAVQAMTGQGGWPLTAFLLPDGRCFYGGTYFPPRDAHGRPSFRRVLEAVADSFVHRRAEMQKNATALEEALGQSRVVAPAPETEWDNALNHAVEHIKENYDEENGGFGRAPKFPHPAALDLLAARGERDVVVNTLEKMRNGGIYDHLGGGFHRYSVDAEWHVPHFEKMLYDNAGLLRNYVRAARAFARDDFLVTAHDIVRFLRDVLERPEGGFGGSQDADINLHDDGNYFTWSLAELREAMGDAKLAEAMALHYGVTEEGDMHHDRTRSVLRIETPHGNEEGKRRMQAARAKRQAPFVDPTRYVAWNGMVIGALFELNEPDTDAMAIRATDAMLRDAYAKGRGFARSAGGKTFGLLDDNAQMLDALLEAHYATGILGYLSTAREVGTLILAEFKHPRGGFADRSNKLAGAAEAAPLSKPERPIQDAPTASASGVALRALLRLSEATGDESFAREARASLRILAGEAANMNLFGGAILLAMHEASQPRPRVVARGDVEAFRRAARAAAVPGATFASPEDEGVPAEARLFPGEGAMVCLGQRCLAPARSPGELAERLRGAQ